MKKIGIILAIVVALTLVVGCGSSSVSSGSSAAKSGGAPASSSYSVDLNSLTYQIFSNTANALSGGGSGKKNAAPLPTKWDGVAFSFANVPADITQYKRVTINAKYFDAKGEEIAQGDSRAMVVMFYDIKGDLKGPEMGAGPNTPIKEFNVGGFSGLVSTDKGVRVNLSKAPGGILLQAADASVKFIEVTQVTFHNGSASGN